MTVSRRTGYAIAATVLICLGLLTRWPEIGGPPGLAKYVGSALWGAMIYCVIGVCFPRRSILQIMLLAFLIAAATELSQLLHTAWLDSFRRTTIGVLLIGRYFSWADIVAYVIGISMAGLVTTWGMRPRCNREHGEFEDNAKLQ